MVDRNVQFPDHFRIEKVPGTDDIFKITPAPGEVHAEGDFLNKSSLLKDATAALYGLDTDAVPDDVLAFLGRFQKNLGNQYLWEKGKTKNVYTESKSIGSASRATRVFNNGASTTTFRVSNNLQDALDGIYTQYDLSPSNRTFLNGKYFRTSAEHSETQPSKYAYIFYVLLSSGWTLWDSPDGYSFQSGAIFTDFDTQHTSYGYVNSSDPAAYPPKEPDGYEYVPLGQVGQKLQIATGSYVGTGTWGENNPTRITLPFSPKYVRFYNINGSESVLPYVGLSIFPEMIRPIEYSTAFRNGTVDSNYTTHVLWGDNYVEWYVQVYKDNGNSPGLQQNHAGKTYRYLAIG